MEKRILLTETTFTGLCKTGFIKCDAPHLVYINFKKDDIRKLISGEVLEKKVEDGYDFKFLLQDIGIDIIIEILRRSPVYSDLSYEF